MADPHRKSELTGWLRWGAWSAHFFIDGLQVCRTAHIFQKGDLGATEPKPAELSAHGVPYGRVCSRCLKLSKEVRRAG